MLQTPRFSHYKNPLCLAFASNVLKILAANEIPALADPITALQSAELAMAKSFKKDLGSAKTEELKNLDERRDNALRGILRIAEGYEFHTLEATRKAGTAILSNIHKYAKTVVQLSYQAETAVIRNILEDWTNDPTLVSAVTALHLGDWKTELENANNAFDSLYLDRNKEIAQRDAIVATSEVRKEVEEKYKFLAKHIDAHAVLNPSETLSNLINEMNSLIEKYNAEVERNSGTTEEAEGEEVAEAS